MLKAPLPLTYELTSISYQAFRPTEPSEPRVAPSTAGWLFQITPVSDQVVLLIEVKVPPLLLSAPETSSVWMRSFAPLTAAVRPETLNLRYIRLIGELSTPS